MRKRIDNDCMVGAQDKMVKGAGRAEGRLAAGISFVGTIEPDCARDLLSKENVFYFLHPSPFISFHLRSLTQRRTTDSTRSSRRIVLSGMLMLS